MSVAHVSHDRGTDKAYYEVLERTQQSNLDITEWMLWFFGCLENAIVRAFGIIERTLQKTAYWDEWAKICSCS